jgi:DNA-binding Lrp family transcriptional regulator
MQKLKNNEEGVLLSIMVDEIDRKIIDALQENGRAPLASIGEKVDRSTVTVWKRLESLLKDKWIKVQANVNINKVYSKIAVLDFEANNFDAINEMMEHFEKCPRVLITYQYGGTGIVSVLMAENLSTLESIIASCSFRNCEVTKRTAIRIGELPDQDLMFPIQIIAAHKTEASPCGCECTHCMMYKKNKCFGCPVTVHYRGNK